VPLLPLPASNTKRYFIGVIADTIQHHIQIRVADTVANADAVTNLGNVVSLLVPAAHDSTTFNELLVAEKNSDIRNPVAGWTTQTGTILVNQPDADRPLTLCARGRASTGRKTKLFLWGINFARTADWMFIPGAGTTLATFLTSLNTAASYFLAIDGNKPVWKSDFTIDFNDHYEKRARP